MKVHIDNKNNRIISFKKNTAMFKEKSDNNIIGVVVYNPIYGRWRFISKEEYNKNIGRLMNVYD